MKTITVVLIKSTSIQDQSSSSSASASPHNRNFDNQPKDSPLPYKAYSVSDLSHESRESSPRSSPNRSTTVPSKDQPQRLPTPPFLSEKNSPRAQSTSKSAHKEKQPSVSVVSPVQQHISHPESPQLHSIQSNSHQTQQQQQQQQQQQEAAQRSSATASNHISNAYGSGIHSHHNNSQSNSGRVDSNSGVASNKTQSKKRSTDNIGSEVTNTNTSGAKDITGRESSGSGSGVIKSITSRMPKTKDSKGGETFDCKSIKTDILEKNL